MIPVSGPLERVARSARVSGIVWAAVGVLALAGTAFLLAIPDRAIDARIAGALLLLLGATLGVYIVPGALLWWLGRRLDLGARWAFVPIIALAIINCLEIFVRVESGAGVLLNLAVRLPTVYLLVCCVEGLADARHDLRQWRQKRRQRGFQVVGIPAPSVVKPPPPARMAPRDRGPARV